MHFVRRYTLHRKFLLLILLLAPMLFAGLGEEPEHKPEASTAHYGR